MEQPDKLYQSKNMATVLNENFSPVARMRLFSKGVQSNNRIVNPDPIIEDKGCLACGCCIDACPVVREKQRFEFRQNRRTSMSLENIVDDECRRCYRCVKACPQVSPNIKEFAWGFRRKEKFIHAWTAASMFTLMVSGILLFHFKEGMNWFDEGLLTLCHRLAGIMLILMPFMFWKIAREQLQRAWKNSFSFTGADRTWLENVKEWIRHPVNKALPDWKEFNPYHKFWFCYLAIVIPVFAVTGFFNFLGEESIGGLYWLTYWVHVVLGMCTDVLVLGHLYFKLMRWVIRNTVDMYRSWRKKKNFDYTFMYGQKDMNDIRKKAPAGNH